MAKIVAGSPEDGQTASDGSGAGAPGEASGAIAPAAMGKQEALKKFTVDLTERGLGLRSRRYAMIVDNGVVRLSIGRKSGGAFGLTSIVDAACPRLPGFAKPERFTF